MLSRFCIVKWKRLKRGFRCSIWWSTRWGSQLSSSRLGCSLGQWKSGKLKKWHACFFFIFFYEFCSRGSGSGRLLLASRKDKMGNWQIWQPKPQIPPPRIYRIWPCGQVSQEEMERPPKLECRKSAQWICSSIGNALPTSIITYVKIWFWNMLPNYIRQKLRLRLI